MLKILVDLSLVDAFGTREGFLNSHYSEGRVILLLMECEVQRRLV